MTTHRIEIRTPELSLPVLTLPRLRLRHLRASLVLQLAPATVDAARRRSADRALAAATERIDHDRAAAHATRLGTL